MTQPVAGIVRQALELLASEPSPVAASRLICEDVRSELDLELVSIYLLDADGSALRLYAASGYPIPDAHRNIKVSGRGMLARAAREQRPVVAPRIRDHQDYVEGNPAVRSELTMPLRATGRMIGCVNLESRQQGFFTEPISPELIELTLVLAIAANRILVDQQARLTEERQRIASEVGRVGVWEADLGSDRLIVDQAVARLLQCKPADLTSANAWFERVHPADRDAVRAAVDAMISGEVTRLDHEFRVVIKGTEQIRWVLARARVVRDDEGRPLRIVGIDTDITENHLVREALELSTHRAQTAAAAKSEFLARMSHELRTPLSGIIGPAGLVARQPLPDPVTKLIETIQLSSQVLLSVINQILDFSKIESGKMQLEREPLDVRRCVKDSIEVTRTAASEKALVLRQEIDPGVPETIVGDHDRLRQILINLLTNAIKFSATGTITLCARSTKADQVEFSVTDEGPGIADELHDDLFQPFVQGPSSRSEGTGLGLAICAELVALMEGHIWIDPDYRDGTAIRFAIRADQPDSSLMLDVGASAPPHAEAALATRVLVVDDNPVSRGVTALQLQSLGCSVSTAADGLDALEVLTDDTFDVILMDCSMPRLDGFDATRAVRRMCGEHQPTIIGLTAFASPQMRDRCIAAGMNGHLAKPVTVEDLSRELSIAAGAPTAR